MIYIFFSSLVISQFISKKKIRVFPDLKNKEANKSINPVGAK